jgi:hypothetical protein
VEEVKMLLSTFFSKYDTDIEHFLKESAIDFSNRGVARTHLVIHPAQNKPQLLGYYTLTNKVLEVPCSTISKSIEKRLSRFGLLDKTTDTYSIPMPLIAQLGKNYTDALEVRINGDELIDLALKKIAVIQYELSGKYTYAECVDTPKLVEYYERNDFRRIDNGIPNAIYDTSKPYLAQMLKYFS